MDQILNNQMPTMPVTPVGGAPMPKNHHVKLIVILAIVLVVVGGLTSFAGYARVFSPVQDIVMDSIKAIYEQKTIHTELSIKASYTDPSKKTQTAELNISGDVDKTDKESPKLSSIISFDGMNMNASAEVRLIKDVLYGRINTIPSIYSSLSTTTREMIGKWYNISKKEVEDVSKSYTNASTTNIVDKNKEYLSEEYINSLFNKYKLFKDFKLKGLSSSNGGYVKRYSMVLDKDALVDMYMDILKKNNKDFDPKTESYYKTTLGQMFGSVNINPVLVDIGMFDNLIKNVQINIDLLPDKDNKYQANINMNISYSNFNKPVDIQIPEGSISLKEIIDKSINESKIKGKASQMKSYVSNIRLAAEMYYDKNNSSYSGLCKTDNANVKGVFNAIKNNGGNITCFAKSDAYSVSSILNDGKYYCVDSTGEVLTLNKPQTSYSCK